MTVKEKKQQTLIGDGEGESFIPVDVSRGVAFEHMIRLSPVPENGINKIKFISLLPVRNGRPFAYNIIYTRRTIDSHAARRHRRRAAGTAHNCGKSIVAKKPVCDTNFAGDEKINTTPFWTHTSRTQIDGYLNVFLSLGDHTRPGSQHTYGEKCLENRTKL